MKEKIIFRNRIEVKILTIGIGIIWGILYAIILTGDLRTHSPHFWHNQKCLLIMLLVFSIPILIIHRFRIIFDFRNKTITHIPYFKPKKIYSMDELDISIQRGKTGFLTRVFVFFKQSKKLFCIQDIDFVYQTRESVDYLKMLLQGDAKFVFDFERALKSEGYYFTPYDYSLAEHFGSIHSRDTTNWITIKFQKATRTFTLQVFKLKIDPDKGPIGNTIIHETSASPGDLARSALALAHQYL